ncbi:tRNA pseudouridine(55) synthase TruB [Pelovirga terrestris]|uniref:tRNA pseudouridine synthase B n=1 Tax=Pelovirga terrestris TaxID=2771352 RepID=A0A8J6QWQ1_9BACT|nr:tRNA pseudouridine(55) synthase TruB [Pelovirga terrestris]
MHGILLIDKPKGLTSYDVVRQVKRIFSTRKVGHAGTLDPMATGVLIVAVGDATKILQFLLVDDKSYRAILKLGETTDTYDAQGRELIKKPVPPLTIDSIDRFCSAFRGPIEQQPPMYSALKRDGVPLYKLARQGLEVERENRSITIERLTVVAVASPFVTIEVDCSKGTYIRSLAHDLGTAIGCGAHLTELCRLRSGRFTIDQCRRLDDLKQLDRPADALLSYSDALADFPAVELDEPALVSLTFGIPPQEAQCRLQQPLTDGERVRLLDQEHRLVAVADYQPLRPTEKRGDFRLIRVF